MKIILIILVLILLSGCGLCNLNYFIMPDDLEFLAIVENLNTPKKISNYMIENFTYKRHALYAPNPYVLWQIKEGDCNDMSTFAVFIANYHNYETWQMQIYFKNSLFAHYIGVYKEYGKLTYTENMYYYPIYVDTFKEVVEHRFLSEYRNYKVYDYDGNLIGGF